MVRIASLLIASLLAGCAASIMQPASPDSVADGSKGYFLGTFINSYRESSRRMGLAFSCDSQEAPVIIELQQPKDFSGLQLFPVPPGNCSLVHDLMMAYDGTINGRFDVINSELAKTFAVEAGKVYYLGNFDGQAENPTRFTLVGAIVAESHKSKNEIELRESGAGFDVTGADMQELQAEFRSSYPQFSSWPISSVYELDEPLSENRADR